MFRSTETEMEIKITPKELEELRKRSEALKNTDEIQQLEEKKIELEKLIQSKRQAILNEEHAINSKTLIKVNSKMQALPRSIPEQSPLLNLLELISRKYSIDVVNGEYNLLTDEVNVLFPKQFVVAGEIQGKGAIIDLESIGGKESTREDPTGFHALSKKVVTLTHAQCQSAIQKLGQLADPTKHEIAKIRAAFYVMG